MVDFDTPEMLSSNKGQITSLIILGRRYDLINSIKSWREAKLNNTSLYANLTTTIRSGLFVLYLEIKESLQRKLKDSKDLEFIKRVVYSSDKNIQDEELIKVFELINQFLDEINLIKIDTRKNIDFTSVETENEESGL